MGIRKRSILVIALFAALFYYLYVQEAAQKSLEATITEEASATPRIVSPEPTE